MTRYLLADTGPLYALAVPRDGLHTRAQEELSRLQAQGLDLLICQPILLETHKLLMRQAGSYFANRYLDTLVESTHVINPQSNQYKAARVLAARYPDQSLTLYDALLAVLSKTLDTPIWTFDKHFDILMANVWRNA